MLLVLFGSFLHALFTAFANLRKVFISTVMVLYPFRGVVSGAEPVYLCI